MYAVLVQPFQLQQEQRLICGILMQQPLPLLQLQVEFIHALQQKARVLKVLQRNWYC